MATRISPRQQVDVYFSIMSLNVLFYALKVTFAFIFLSYRFLTLNTKFLSKEIILARLLVKFEAVCAALIHTFRTINCM